MLPARAWATAAGQTLAGGGSGPDSWRAAGAFCEMISRATLTHRRPAFGIARVQVRQPGRAGARGGGLRHALRHPLALCQGRRAGAAQGPAGGAAQRSFLDPAARHRARAAARARCAHHRLGQCPRCRGLARPLRLRRICRTPDVVPPRHGAGCACDRRLPALRAGPRGRCADGRGRPSLRTRQPHFDGGADRHAGEPDQGERARHRQADRLVRAQPDRPRAAALSRRHAARLSAASCSSPPS